MIAAYLTFLVFFGFASVVLGFMWLGHDARARGRAATSTIGGALLLAYAALVAYPHLMQPDRSAEIEKLKAQSAALTVDNADLSKAVTSLQTENAALETSRTAMLRAERGRQVLLSDRLRDIDQGAVVARPGSDIVTGGIAIPTRPAEIDAAHRALAEEIEMLRRRWLQRHVAAPANPDGQRDLMRLRDRMATRLETDNYSVEVFPDKEVVRGRAGRYYVVDMKDAKSGIRFQFEGGKYTLNRTSAEFRTALNSFVGDIVKKLHGNVGYDLYVRGSADRVAYRGRQEPGFEYRRIRYMRAVSPGKYVNEFSEHTVDADIHNEDLPHLRAAFLQDLVSDVYPTKPPTILQGGVTSEANSRDRNVEMLLFVDW